MHTFWNLGLMGVTFLTKSQKAHPYSLHHFASNELLSFTFRSLVLEPRSDQEKSTLRVSNPCNVMGK